MTWPDVYVLMRIYCPDLNDRVAFVSRLNKTLESVKKEKERYSGKVFFLFNDDTVRGNSDSDYKDYEKLRNQALDDNKLVWTETKDDNPGGKGSSYSTYLVRKLFLDVAQNDTDIAISLDQDDLLKRGAIENIARSMCRGGIVVSPFNIKDSSNLDITDDGGKIHNRLARKMSCARAAARITMGKITLPEDKYGKLFFPRGKNEWIELFGVIKANIALFKERKACRKRNRKAGDHCLSELSSLGWTKSYTKKVLKDYIDDLTNYIDVQAFCAEHRAYEDFIDFYPLLYKDVVITGVKEATYDYVKNPDSITSSPKVDDFRDLRTASLIALIDLCYAKEDKLCDNYKIKLHRFVASKVSQIESIINRYNTDFIKNGDERFADFAARTHRGFFMSKLARLALWEKRDGLKQDDELFQHSTSRREKSADNFSDLFSGKVFNSVPYYRETVSNSSPRYVLRRSVAIEGSLRNNGNKESRDMERKILSAGAKTPNQRRLRRLWGTVIVCSVLLVFGVLVLIWKLPAAAVALKLEGDNQYLASIKGFQQILAAFVALVGVIATILAKLIGEVKILATDEEAKVKLYYSEFQDFIRHLEANLKVMIQVRKELLEGKNRVESIHFDNLKWPTSSILFSDEMAKLIARERVDDFARLKVNIRNINNSASWLQQLAGDEKELLKALEWEITRYFGYLVNMYYLSNNDFCFPSPDEIDRYIHENSIKNKLTSLFMDYDSGERSEQVDYFIDRYNDDRRMKRAVLVDKEESEDQTPTSK